MAERREDPDRVVEILDAACRVIARDGWTGLRMDAVAREAGVSKALVHYYFATRKGLLRVGVRPFGGPRERARRAGARPPRGSRRAARAVPAPRARRRAGVRREPRAVERGLERDAARRRDQAGRRGALPLLDRAALRAARRAGRRPGLRTTRRRSTRPGGSRPRSTGSRGSCCSVSSTTTPRNPLLRESITRELAAPVVMEGR